MSVFRTTTTGVRVDAITTIDAAVDLASDALRQRSRFLMTFVNPGTAAYLQRRPQDAALFEAFDSVAPDGIAMAMAIRLVHRRPAMRVSFDSTALAPHIWRMAAERGSRIVLCGGQRGVAECAKHQLVAAYPGLNIVGTFDGYAKQGWLIAEINKLAPEIVICGMGTPLQEAFLLALSESGWQGVGFTCGGFLDQLSKGLQYYPRWIDASNLRWAYRLAMEPRRLWRRYLLDYPRFSLLLCKELVIGRGRGEQRATGDMR